MKNPMFFFHDKATLHFSLKPLFIQLSFRIYGHITATRHRIILQFYKIKQKLCEIVPTQLFSFNIFKENSHKSNLENKLVDRRRTKAN